MAKAKVRWHKLNSSQTNPERKLLTRLDREEVPDGRELGEESALGNKVGLEGVP